MKQFRAFFTALILLGASAVGGAVESPLPPMDMIVSRAIQAAQNESSNDRAFNRHFFYTRTKTTDYHNAAGDLKEHDEKQNANDPMHPTANQLKKISSEAKVDSAPTSAPTDAQVSGKGKTIDKKDFPLNGDLIKRFTLTLVGSEIINGRPALIVDFKPAGDNLPVNNFKDKFINHAAGRVWVDAGDYSLVKADLHLTQPVSIFGGLAGVVRKFDYSFDRVRTADGLWFPSDVNWHFEGREILVNRVIDYHEKTTDVKKVM
jgi:hypothetical protein